MRIAVQFLLMALAPAFGGASDTRSRPCEEAPEFRALDFWIGDWAVETKEGKPAGSNRIELVLGSCIVLENWTGANGYEGKSFNLFHRETSKWEQVWVDNMGQMTKYEGEAREGNLYYRTEERGADGKTTLRRMTFYRVAPDQVRQLGEASQDAGKTWTIEYDLLYKRRK
jgi:hypothetical protein